MAWRESTNHVDDCYFCSIHVRGVNKKKCKSFSYKSFPSAIRPIAHSTDILIPEFNKLPDLFIAEHSDEEQHMITKNLLMLMMTTKTLHALPCLPPQ